MEKKRFEDLLFASSLNRPAGHSLEWGKIFLFQPDYYYFADYYYHHCYDYTL